MARCEACERGDHCACSQSRHCECDCDPDMAIDEPSHPDELDRRNETEKEAK